jgi:hypothetical protein
MNGMEASPQPETTADAAKIADAERKFIAAREMWHQDRESKSRQERRERRDD